MKEFRGAMLAAVLACLCAASAARAATPVSGTISNATPTFTWSSSIFGAGTGEGTCVEGVSCDTVRITLAPGDYTGKRIRIHTSSMVPANDYDIYVHKDGIGGVIVGSDNGPAPPATATVYISIMPPVVVSARSWTVHEVAASVAPGLPVSGEAAVVAEPVTVTPNYVAGTLPFSATVPLFARGTVRDCEPSIRCDIRGNCYVGSIRGVPAGVDLWRLDLNPSSPTFDPELRNAAYLGQPDVFTQMGAGDSTAGGADGGGDIDIALGFPTHPDSVPALTIVSLAVADISSSVSYNRGQTFQHNAAAAHIPSDDRQWVDAIGPDTVYLFYRAPVPSTGLFVERSTDHGATFGSPTLVDPNAASAPGYIAVDRNNGYVYVSHDDGSALFVSRSTDRGASFTTATVDNSTTHGHIFDPVRVGNDGTVYTAWSSEDHIYVSYSTDHGLTWTPRIQVDDGSTATNVLPWLEAGDAGRLEVVWYGSTSANVNSANWHVYFSQSLNSLAPTPTFRQQRVSDHVIHGSNISEGGLTGAANRNLADYFQITYDPQGAAVIAFCDDHNDADGATYVVRQLGGAGMYAAANGGTGTVVNVPATQLPVYNTSLPEVVDPVHDALARLQPIPTDNPFDIVSIKYFADNNGPNAPYIGARMTLSGLTTMPPGGNWRMVFAADAPGILDQRPHGVSDHGRYFYLLASDTTATPTFTYGIGYRDSMPLLPAPAGSPFSMAYAYRGVADSGTVDTTTGVITVKISLAKINALLPAEYMPLGPGSWVGGLRGSATGPNGVPSDATRGGRFNFRILAGDASGVDAPGLAPLALTCSPNPMRGRTDVQYSVSRPGLVSLAVFDVEGRRVRSLHMGNATAGSHALSWDGRTEAGQKAASGVYFMRLLSDGKERIHRLVMLR